MEVVLVRHGQTEWSESGRHTGRTDLPLTAEGERRARALAPLLAGRAFARVFASPLGRALETCRLAGFADEAETRDDLMEWDYGDYEGRTTAEIRSVRPDWSLWTDGTPGGEHATDVGHRADRMLREVRSIDGDVLLFAHGHVLRVLTARWLGLPPEDGKDFALEAGALSVLGYERENPVILRWNTPA